MALQKEIKKAEEEEPSSRRERGRTRGGDDGSVEYSGNQNGEQNGGHRAAGRNLVEFSKP